MNSNDIYNNPSGIRGMQGRLNFYDNIIPTQPLQKQAYNLDGIKTQEVILNHNGGITQQDRMIFDKRRSLDRALKYSYQAAIIKKVSCTDDISNDMYPNIQETDEHSLCRALINPDKLKLDYDDKILSVHYEENFHAGDIFEWVGTNSYWICYLQDLDEKAYFRCEIRRCSYEISWEDEDGEVKSTYVAVRGPVETKIDYIQKHQISIDNPNYSLSIYMPRNEDTLKYFRRYAKFYLQGVDEGSPDVCWRVEATDWISSPGILEVVAVEYYINETEDEPEKGLVGTLKTKVIDTNTNEVNNYISGNSFIKPKVVNDYYFTGLNNSSWKIKEDKIPVQYKVDPNDPLHLKLIWSSTYSGQFTLVYGTYEKVIVVESLF